MQNYDENSMFFKYNIAIALALIGRNKLKLIEI